MNRSGQGPASDIGQTPENSTQGWNWHPPLPIDALPIFAVPPDPVRFFRWFRASWLSFSARVMVLLLSIATWLFFQPALERCREFEWNWMLQMFGRNLAMMVIIAGSVHLYFCTFKKQGKKLKFDSRDQARSNSKFTFNNQVYDNIFWSLASGVTIWTGFEIISMWAFANGYIALLNWREHPVLFVLMVLIIPVWNSMHFYWVHRLLHWPPLYKRVHALHHRNINVGPWAGISMHPVEHVMYFSSVCIHWLIASHPVHVFYNLHFQTINAVLAHSGFENLLVNDRRRLALGNFYHQLHHRYFECNYGNGEMPWDKWLGSFHNGTPEARERIRQRQRDRARANS